MKPIKVNSSIYIDFGKENNDKNPKVKLGDHVRISKYKNTSAKCYVSYCSEEGFVIKNVKNICY